MWVSKKFTKWRTKKPIFKNILVDQLFWIFVNCWERADFGFTENVMNHPEATIQFSAKNFDPMHFAQLPFFSWKNRISRKKSNVHERKIRALRVNKQALWGLINCSEPRIWFVPFQWLVLVCLQPHHISFIIEIEQGHIASYLTSICLFIFLKFRRCCDFL